MDYSDFRDALKKRFLLPKNRVSEDFSEFRKNLQGLLDDEFGKDGFFEGKSGNWFGIYKDLTKFSKEIGTMDKQFRKDMLAGEGGREKVFALYFGLHTTVKINSETRKPYPFKKIAEQLDLLAFNKVFDDKFETTAPTHDWMPEENPNYLNITYDDVSIEDTSEIERESVTEKSPILSNLITTPLYIQSKTPSLSPLNHSSTLHGRDNDIAKLNNFLNDDSAFEFMFIVGPSGAGKTRLVTQWFSEEVNLTTWQAGFVEDDNKEDAWKIWANEPLTCDTLIVVDYIYRFKEVVRQVIEKGHHSALENNQDRDLTPNPNTNVNNTKPSLRLLVLDHVLPKDATYNNMDFLHRDLIGDKEDQINDRLENLQKYKPMYLELSEDELQEIIKEACPKKVSDKDIKTAYSALEKIDKQSAKDEKGEPLRFARQPLFAILIGKSLEHYDAKDIQNWQRAKLIGEYFNDGRLPWGENNTLTHGDWIGASIAAATALQGIAFDTITKALMSCGVPLSRKKAKNDFISDCNQLVSSLDGKQLKRYEPDILGETLFLLFYQEYGYATLNEDSHEKNVRDLFFTLICHEKPKDPIYPTPNERFIEFIQRTVRNLLNDNQNSEEVEDAWLALTDFLNPNNFRNNEDLKLSAMVSCTKTIQEIRCYSHNNNKHIENISSNVEWGYLISSFMSIFSNERDFVVRVNSLEPVLFSICHYLDFILENDAMSEELKSSALLFFEYYESKSNVLNKKHFLPAFSNTPFLLKWLLSIDPDIDINKPNKNDWNPLLISCQRNAKRVLHELCKNELVDINFQGYKKYTALILVSIYFDEKLVETILKNDRVNVNLRDENENSALHYLAFNLKGGAIKKIIEYGSKVDIDTKNKEGFSVKSLMFFYGDRELEQRVNEAADGTEKSNLWTFGELKKNTLADKLKK